jgi:ferric-dicitrate binding protein FerR (iron transport regulator)/TolA-binding protein
MTAEKSGSACAEVQRLLVEGPQVDNDAATEARMATHLGRCPDCQRARDRLHALRADVERSVAPLDDMRRARVLVRLASALDDHAADGGARRRARGLASPAGVLARGRWRWVLAAALGGTAAVLVVWLSVRQPSPVAPVANTPVAPLAARPPQRLAVLQPYRPANARGAGPRAPAAPVDRLQLPAGTRLRLHLGSRATATLIGPAQLRVVRNQPDLLEVNLDQGTLVADYDHGAGGQLLVRSPGALTRVVGTLFSVKASATSSRIVVARGRVLVTGERGPVHSLTAGDALSTDRADPQRWTRDDRRPLQQHARADADAAQRSAAPAPTPGRPVRLAAPAAAVPATPAPTTSDLELPAPVAVDPPEPPAAPLTRSPAAPLTQLPAPRPALSSQAAPTPAPATPPPIAPAPPGAEALYQRAEQAMRRRDWATARRQLAELVALRGGHPLEDVARYELAQLALRAGDRGQAVALLEDLLRNDREPALRQPAWLLRCELHLQAGERPQGRRCLERFRATYPYTPHDEPALGLLVETLAADGACAGAAEIAAEYLQRHPDGPRAEDARRLQARCVR